MAKLKLHTKEELDLLSEEKIKTYRVNLLQNSPYYEMTNLESTINKYLLELGLYMDIRFKQTIFDRYGRWAKTYKKDPENNPDLKVIVSIVNKHAGKNSLYYLHIASEMKKVKEFKYILGVEVKIPKKYKEFVKS
jgi:hypothetical protein